MAFDTKIRVENGKRKHFTILDLEYGTWDPWS